MADEQTEQTLHITRSVDVFQIPPRPPTGHKSGEWLISSKIFTGMLRVVSRGEICEIRLEDANTDQLFACCPISYGMRNICVEPVADSSRYYVLRVEDPASKRHAFLGMGFAQRGEAFDFNEALVRHEKWVERERASVELAAQAGGAAPSQPAAGPGGRVPQQSLQAAAATKEVAALYSHSAGSMSLQAGQTIHVNLKAKPANGNGTSWLKAGGGPAPAAMVQAPTATGLFKLAPPPADLLGGSPLTSPTSTAPSWQASAAIQPPTVPKPAPAASPDLLGFDTFPTPQAPSQPAHNSWAAPSPAPTATPVNTGWAVFD